LVLHLEIAQGVFNYAQARNDIAREHFENALDDANLIPANQYTAEYWNNKGIAHHYLQQYDEAINCFDKAIELDPNFYKAFHNKGLSLRNIGNYHEALRSIEKSITIKPQYYLAWNSKGLVLNDLRQYDKAIECFDKVISEHHGGVLVKYAISNKVIVFANTGNIGDAYNLAENELSEINKQYALDTRAFVLFKMQKLDDAEELLNKAIIADKDDKLVWLHAGNVHHEKKEYDSAVRCYNKALKLDPDFAEAHNDKAVSLSKQDMKDDAIQHLKNAITIKPSMATAHHNLAILAAGNSSRQTFWDYWSATRTKIIVAILLGVAAFSLVFYSIHFLPSSVEVSTNSTGKTIGSSGTNITTTTTKPPPIPESYLVIVGLIILVLLSPIIRSIKAGPIEFTLADTERVPQPLTNA
jgi:tetratricopeptide (TPR) repeat protein